MKYLKLIIGICLATSFIACENESAKPQNAEINKIEFDKPLDLQLPFETPNYRYTVNLDKMDSQQQLDSILNLVSAFDSELSEIINKNGDNTYSFKIKYSKNSLVFEDFKISKNTKSLPQMRDPSPVVLSPSCPEGYDFIDKCLSESCVRNTTEEILTDGLSGVGDCVNIQYNYTLTGVNVCASGC